jgi:isopenicillin N synthase-like dioxygenase
MVLQKNTQIPLIDVSKLLSGGPETLEQTAAEIGGACRTTGFFYITGHNVPQAMIEAAFRKSREFFALGQSQKDEVSFFHSPHNRGYIGFLKEALDATKPPDLKEAFNIGLELAPDDRELLAGVPFRGSNLWPGDAEFRDIMLAYFDAVWKLGRQLHRAFALDLKLLPDFFEDKLDKPMATLRLLHYLPHPQTFEAGQLGAGEHTDYGNITLLTTDAVEGLEVRTRAGEWLAAPAITGALVCNIGDCLMRWTNDVYVSTPHRVAPPKSQERYSIAFFLDPNPDAIVECLPACVEPEGKPRYAPIRGDDFLRSRLNPSYAHNANEAG